METVIEKTIVRFFEWADFRVPRLFFGFFCLGFVCFVFNRLLAFVFGGEFSAIICSTIAVILSFASLLAMIVSR